MSEIPTLDETTVKIEGLISQPGYFYALLRIAHNDLFLPIDQFEKVDWWERLSYQELGYLMGLLVRTEIDLSVFPDKETCDQYMQQTYSLLEDLHLCGKPSWKDYTTHPTPWLTIFCIIKSMYCSSCGNKLDGNEKFCTNCGNEIVRSVEEPIPKEDETQPSSNKTPAPSPEQNILDPETKAKLVKTYRDTGNSSFALGILSLVLTFLVNISEFGDDGLIYGLIDGLFVIPFIYFGLKLKNEGINNLQYAFKVSKGLLIYLVIFLVLLLIVGEYAGWLWLLLLYYFYKSYNETKKALN